MCVGGKKRVGGRRSGERVLGVCACMRACVRAAGKAEKHKEMVEAVWSWVATAIANPTLRFSALSSLLSSSTDFYFEPHSTLLPRPFSHQRHLLPCTKIQKKTKVLRNP